MATTEQAPEGDDDSGSSAETRVAAAWDRSEVRDALGPLASVPESGPDDIAGMTVGAFDGATDGALARRAGLGDAEAFAELFDRHWFATFRYAMRMLDHNEHDAQDAAQEAWMGAWKNLGGFRGQSAFRTWIFTITYRQVLRCRQARRPRLVDDRELGEMLDKPDTSAPGPEGALEDLEVKQALALALAELPWRQRGAWLLREIEGLSYEEISEVLGTTPTVVRGQLHRARRAVTVRMKAWQ